MPNEVSTNRLGELRRRGARNAEAAVRAAVEANESTSRAIVPVSELDKEHLRDTIHGSVSTEGARIEGVVKAGDPAKGIDYPWHVEAGTRSRFDPPETAEPYPPGGSEGTGSPSQPFMGPGYEAGRRVVEDRNRRILE